MSEPVISPKNKQSQRKKSIATDGLVSVERGFVFCDSHMIAEKFDVDHNKVVRTIKNFIDRFDRIKVDMKSTLNLKNPPVFKETEKEYRGQIFNGYEMNKTAFEHISTKFKTDLALEWQLKFIDAFDSMERTISQIANQKANAEWLEARKAGKFIRREETDIVKQFVEYATSQGSKNAHHYYSNISKMENKALFLLDQKYNNIRELLDMGQLMMISVADKIVSKALKEGMKNGLYYKDIYQNAKQNIELLAIIHGKSKIPNSIVRIAA